MVQSSVLLPLNANVYSAPTSHSWLPGSIHAASSSSCHEDIFTLGYLDQMITGSFRSLDHTPQEVLDANSNYSMWLDPNTCLHPDLQITLPFQTPAAVKNGLIQPEAASYSMAWKEKINPQSAPLSAFYSAMGPDVSTILYTTNATTVYGVDWYPMIPEGLQKILELWQALPTYQMENLYPGLSDETQYRCTRGFWHIRAIKKFGLELLTVAELVRLGVDLSSIQVSIYSGGTRLQFDWAYPGEFAKPRNILFFRANILQLFQTPGAYEIPQFDVFFQKAGLALQKKVTRIIPGIDHIIAPEGFILLGRPAESPAISAQIETDVREQLGSNYQSVEIDSSYDQMMNDAMMQPTNLTAYGWQLYGAQKEK